MDSETCGPSFERRSAQSALTFPLVGGSRLYMLDILAPYHCTPRSKVFPARDVRRMTGA